MAAELGDALNVAVLLGPHADAELCMGRPARALELVETALPAFSDEGAVLGRAPLLEVRGRALAALGRLDAARAALEEAVESATALPDPWVRARAELALARFLVRCGDRDAVPVRLKVARTCGAALGSAWVPAVADHLAGLVATAQGDLARAEDLQHAALAVHVAHGYKLDAVDALEALADLCVRQESWTEAARLLGATSTRRGELEYRNGAEETDPARFAVHGALGEEAFAAAVKEGEELSIEAAVAYATRARGERGRPSFGWASLTPTELEVARLAASGATNPEIGRALFVSRNTIKVHLSHVYAKLGLANRTELAAELARRDA